MPEIAEVARVVHYLKKNLVGKTLKSVFAQDDANVYGKVGTSGTEFSKALTGKKVIGASQQGKYFWLLMDSPPHPVMHLGMTGWVHIRGQRSVHYRPKHLDEEESWPPTYWKFIMETDGEPKTEVAFTDARRFARIRLVDCAAEDIRNTTPLKENGPDPVIDRELLTEEWLVQKMGTKHVPVKALLLNQANISGIGNWVGDEILYHAKLHPEQYSDTFSAAQLKQLHTSILYVTKTAVDLLADSSKFPDEWLFNHRWGKGKKDAPTKLPSGAAITFLTVGGRTSCVVPSVQKKTGAVAADIKANTKELKDGAEPIQSKTKTKTKAKKRKAETESEESDIEPTPKAVLPKGRKPKKEAVAVVKEESEPEEDLDEELEKPRKGTKSSKPAPSKKVKKEEFTEARRSRRHQG